MDKEISNHLEVLTEKVFQVSTKWPQFRLLISDLETLSNKYNFKNQNVVILERTLMYGGLSLIAPIFKNSNCKSIDLSPSSADARGAYNSKLVNDERFMKIKHHFRSSRVRIDLEDNSTDLIVIPNLVHHIEDQESLLVSQIEY